MSDALTYIPYLYAFKYKGHYVYSYKYYKDQGLLVFFNLLREVVHREYIPLDIFMYLYYHKDEQLEFENIASSYGEELCYYKYHDKQGAV